METRIDSARWKLNGEDLRKIGKGALIALVGALIVWLSGLPESIDWGVYSPFVAAVASVLVNILRKWVSERKGE